MDFLSVLQSIAVKSDVLLFISLVVFFIFQEVNNILTHTVLIRVRVSLHKWMQLLWDCLLTKHSKMTLFNAHIWQNHKNDGVPIFSSYICC